MVLPTPEIVTLFREGMRVLAEVEHNGIRVDEVRLEEVIQEVRSQITQTTKRLQGSNLYAAWRKKYGLVSNLWSSDQLKWVLYTHLGCKATHFTEKGSFSATKEALQDLEVPDEHKTFFTEYIQVKELDKLQGTYLENIQKELVEGMIHPFYHLASGDGSDSKEKGGAKTGRMSASNPNLQNIPIRNERIGGLIRSCFVPRKGRVFVETDYSALEFKVAAMKWRDQGMIDYASDDSLDIHRDFTAEVYSCEKSQVSKMMRSIGKNQFVFPVLYGSDYINCSKNLWGSIDKFSLKLQDGTLLKDHLAAKEVKSLGACERNCRPRPGTFEGVVKKAEETFFTKFPTFAERKEKWWKEYEREGGFRMMSGFACNGEYSRNFLMNADIQGSGAHLLLQSMVWLHDWLKEKHKKSVIVAPIHDCILKDCLVSEIQEVLNATEYFMSQKIAEEWDWVCVPLKVEVDVTPVDGSWAEKSPWAKKDGKWGPK